MKTLSNTTATHMPHLARLSLLLSLLAASLVGCASLGLGSPEQRAVTQRANARWHALAGADWATAYTYNTPGFNAVVDPSSFKSRFGNAVQWTGGEVQSVSCQSATKCTAKLRIESQAREGQLKGKTFSSVAEETWIYTDGHWFYFQTLKAS